MKERVKNRTQDKNKNQTRDKTPKKPGGYKTQPTKKAAATGLAKKQKSTDSSSKYAKMTALAEVDALLGKPGAVAAGIPLPVPVKPPKPGSSQREMPAHTSPPPVETQSSRFERCLIRAQKGEPGPIRLGDLTLDPEICRTTKETGQIDAYKRILESTPHAQPGRPLVNIVGGSDADLRFDLLSLYELVMAAIDLGREQLQVSLVRLSDEEAQAIMTKPAPVPAPDDSEVLSPADVARMNGFLEIDLGEIYRDENLRQHIDEESPEFRNLMESIRTIGLQNPPVLEVRHDLNGDHKLVCISGHRRLLALEKLGVQKVVCALKLFESNKHRALAGLAENINREDLHFLDKADGYGLLSQQGMSASEIAALLDADTRTVGKYLRAAEWDKSVKKRIRDMGNKATIRFLLNSLAAGERTAAELHAMIDRFQATFGTPSSKQKPPTGGELKRKLGEFCVLAGYGDEERVMIEKALRYLGYLS